MALHNLPKSLFCIIVLMAMTYETHCLRLGISAKKTKPIGLCQSSFMVHKYRCEEVHVTTKDGFNLSLQRISKGRNTRGENHKSRRPPVLLQHGLFVDGITWLMNSPEHNLPMILVEQGFDVWISNLRGTKYSRSHKSLRPNQREFWNWSWDELATFDLPAIVDHIYKVTGQKIHYVGHSMGTLIVLASLSERHLVDKLKSTVLLCPIAYSSHMKAQLAIIAAKAFLGEIGEMFGLAEFNPKEKPVVDFIDILCHIGGLNCYDLMATCTGKNCCLNTSTVDLFMKHEPQSTSLKNLVHFSQTVRDGVLRKFKYNTVNENMKHYGSKLPPVYNLSNIPHDFPIFLSHGGKDALSDAQDVRYLLDDLKFHNVNKIHTHFVEKYAHVDFIMGLDGKDIVYNHIISFFRYYN
ncbi:Triacylglycerol lipase 2 [Linum grandiflorum]